MATHKSYKKSTNTKTRIRLSPKDADKILEQEFIDDKTGIPIKTIIRFSPEPYLFKINLDGVQKKEDKDDNRF